MKEVAYTIPGVVDENGDPVLFVGMAMPGHALPAQTRGSDGQCFTTPATADIVNARDTRIPAFLPSGEID